MGQHSQVESRNEIFSRYMPRRRGGARLPSIAEVFNKTQDEQKKQLQLIEIKYLRAQNLGLYPEMGIQAWLEVAATHGYREHMILHRNNGLRRIVSHLMGQKTGIYVLKQESAIHQPERQETMHVNCDEITEGFETNGLIKWLEVYEHSYAQLRSNLIQWREANGCNEPLCLSYEQDIEATPLVGYNKTCDYLGIQPESPAVQLKRINGKPLSELLDNYDEVADHLASTRFAWMLDE
jgi:hypothetical protein